MDVLMDGMDVLQNALGRLQKVAREPEAILRDIGIIVEGTSKKSFGNQKAPDIVADVTDGKAQEAAGASWAELAEVTVKRRRNKKKGSIRILQDMGDLKLSINSRVNEDSVTIGSGLQYGKWHQGGTKRMPARPFIGYNTADEQRFINIVLKHIEAACK